MNLLNYEIFYYIMYNNNMQLLLLGISLLLYQNKQLNSDNIFKYYKYRSSDQC